MSPIRARRFCPTPQCPNYTDGGPCEACKRRRWRQVDRKRVRVPELHTYRWRIYSEQRLARYPWCVGYPAGVHGALRVIARCTDHIRAAREAPDLFWNPANHQSLCDDCNARKGIAEEGGFGHGKR